jgi:N-acetylmuramoyl-L-alanine amidase
MIHIVRQGDSIISLSKRYGIPVDKILNHPDNSSLRERKRNASILFPGDRITVPDRELKEEEGATEQRHRFQCSTRTTWLKLRILKEGEARANEPYHLIVEGQDFRGNLDDEGRLEVRIPGDAHQATLWLGEEEEEMSLRIGNLDPVDEVSGIQERLNNLGYYCGAEDNIMGPRTEAAIALFQAEHGLDQTGQIDDATKRRIEEIQGI